MIIFSNLLYPIYSDHFSNPILKPNTKKQKPKTKTQYKKPNTKTKR
jgi:hypothetical protein